MVLSQNVTEHQLDFQFFFLKIYASPTVTVTGHTGLYIHLSLIHI